MGMKRVTKLSLGTDFNKLLQVKIDDLIHCHMTKEESAAIIKVANENLVTEVRSLVMKAYAMGVVQGKIEGAVL